VFSVQVNETHILTDFVIPTGQPVLLGQFSVWDRTQEIGTEL